MLVTRKYGDAMESYSGGYDSRRQAEYAMYICMIFRTRLRVIWCLWIEVELREVVVGSER